jgi:hypothetical protein
MARQASFSVGTGVSSGMKRPERETDHLPAPSATCFLELNTALTALAQILSVRSPWRLKFRTVVSKWWV